jgi:hypothetical protein
MNRLCFATVAKLVQDAIQPPDSNQAVVELLYDLITEGASSNELSPNFSVKAKTVSGLMNFEEDVHRDVVALSSSAKVIAAMPERMALKVVGSLKPMLVDDLIENLMNLVNADKSVSKAKRKEFAALAKKDRFAEFLSAVYLYALNKPNKAISSKDSNKEDFSSEFSLLDDAKLLHEIYARMPKPKNIPMPADPTYEEMEYIAQLLAAYAEAEGVSELSSNTLGEYPSYKNDLRQRRKEYYAAETIRRGTREVFGANDPDHFELLKDETYDGIFDVYSMDDYKHGYDKLLKVLAQVSAFQINKSPLSQLQWTGPKEMKGVCHILVNDGTIKWVVRDE